VALGLDAPAIVTPPGTWLVDEAYIKPFAGVRHAHYAAAAAIDLRGGIGAAEDVAAVTLHTYAEALRYAGNRAPASAITAQFSLSWAVAAALVQGDLGPAAYTDAALADPALRRIESLVVLNEDVALTQAGRRGAALRVVLRDGTALSARADRVPGDPDLPMEPDAVRAKFLRFAAPVVGEAAARAALQAMLDGPEDARPGAALVGPAPA
jgi:2-methylcitrate dehydratase PrpD